ncbi:hypothetical protein RJ640_027727 [Escallonia rubra]|uniref:Expansin-like EG45 domain-containing protein n=1 Tax=Escallonia rubra TaxID=112253 RepID=A0AA88S4I5_9ASTE|nr:hypothetical protein RJ640_027727 [Escallonia rubra]
MEDLHVDMNRTNRLMNLRLKITEIGFDVYALPDNASACDGFEEQGVMVAAASDEFWDNGGACGSWYRVKCIGATNQGNPDPCNGDNSVVVKIVDYCPSGCQGTIDLSQEAFALIADPAAGKIQVEYDSI